MPAVNFAEALNKSASDIEAPKNPPVGSYTFQITKVPAFPERGDYTFIEFPCIGVAASDEIDADELASVGGLKATACRLSFGYSKTDERAQEQTLFRLKTFLTEHLGLDPKLSMKELLTASLNQRFTGSTHLRPNPENPEIQYFEIARTAPVA